MKIRPIPLLLSLALSTALAPGVRAEPSAQAPSAELAPRIDRLAADYLARPGAVGLSVAVARHGEVLLEKGYGLADLELEAPANERTMFRIGSVTKQFTAALILRLVERGKLALGDELAPFLPGFPLGGRRVTIEQLLEHTSGIKSYTEINENWMRLWPLELTHAEVLGLIERAPFDFEPGLDWGYSNTGYYLLGMVIEQRSGRSYAEVLQDELCRPLGLAHTRYDSNHDLIRGRAQGYALEGGELVNDQPFGMSQPGAAGGILSTAGDLVRWQMALSSGRVVTRESFARMCTPTVLPNGHDTRYGFGLRMDELAGRTRVQHGGGIFGFNSMLFWLPDEDLHVAVISNGEALPSAELADDVAYAALGLERPTVKDEPIPDELIDRLSGDYDFAGIGLQARIFEQDAQLMMQSSGQPAFRLQWQGGLEFRADFDTDVRLVFAEDGRSLVLHQGWRKAEGARK